MEIATRLLCYKDTVKLILLDNTDEDKYDEFKWNVNLKNGIQNIKRTFTRDDNKKETVYLHRAVLNIPNGDPRIIQHINGNRFDNRKENLLVHKNREAMQDYPTQKNMELFLQKQREMFIPPKPQKGQKDRTKSKFTH